MSGPCERFYVQRADGVGDRAIPVGISSCLLGERVRFDGGHKLDRSLRDTLGALVTWVPVCPEAECGMPVPREPLRLTGDPVEPRLITVRTGVDHTAEMQAWAARRLDALALDGLCGFVFKNRSPSCGLRCVAIHPPGDGATTLDSVGLFARAFRLRFPLLPVEEDESLRDPARRALFIERLLAFAREREQRRRVSPTPPW